MSAAGAVATLVRVLERRVARVTPFRAIVTATSGGSVKLRPVGATTAGDQWVPTLASATVAVDDEVLVANVEGDWIVLGVIDRTT